MKATVVVGILVLLALPALAGAKESSDPVNRIFLIGDSAEWVDTRLRVSPPDHVTIRASSVVCFSGGSDASCVRPTGWPRETYHEQWPGDAAGCEDPFPEWNHAALVARIGEETFEVGRSLVVEGKDGRLELAINDCSFDGEHRNAGQFSVVIVVENPTAHAARSGLDLIEEAIGAMGGKATRRVSSLRVRATGSGPAGAFSIEVFSIRPDQTLLQRSTETSTEEWVAIGEQAWQVDRERGRRKPVSKKMRSTIAGQEFQLMLFELDERFQKHTVALETQTVEDGEAEAIEPTDDCVRVEMEDLYGSPAAVCLDAETKLPVRLSFQPPGGKKQPTVELELESWREIDGAQYLEAFTLTQGEDVLTYEYDEIRPNSVDRATFKAVSQRSLDEIRKRLKAAEDPDAPEAPEDAEEIVDPDPEDEDAPPSVDGGEPPTGS